MFKLDVSEILKQCENKELKQMNIFTALQNLKKKGKRPVSEATVTADGESSSCTATPNKVARKLAGTIDVSMNPMAGLDPHSESSTCTSLNTTHIGLQDLHSSINSILSADSLFLTHNQSNQSHAASLDSAISSSRGSTTKNKLSRKTGVDREIENGEEVERGKSPNGDVQNINKKRKIVRKKGKVISSNKEHAVGNEHSPKKLSTVIPSGISSRSHTNSQTILSTSSRSSHTLKETPKTKKSNRAIKILQNCTIPPKPCMTNTTDTTATVLSLISSNRNEFSKHKNIKRNNNKINKSMHQVPTNILPLNTALESTNGTVNNNQSTIYTQNFNGNKNNNPSDNLANPKCNTIQPTVNRYLSVISRESIVPNRTEVSLSNTENNNSEINRGEAGTSNNIVHNINEAVENKFTYSSENNVPEKNQNCTAMTRCDSNNNKINTLNTALESTSGTVNNNQSTIYTQNLNGNKNNNPSDNLANPKCNTIQPTVNRYLSVISRESIVPNRTEVSLSNTEKNNSEINRGEAGTSNNIVQNINEAVENKFTYSSENNVPEKNQNCGAMTRCDSNNNKITTLNTALESTNGTVNNNQSTIYTQNLNGNKNNNPSDNLANPKCNTIQPTINRDVSVISRNESIVPNRTEVSLSNTKKNNLEINKGEAGTSNNIVHNINEAVENNFMNSSENNVPEKNQNCAAMTRCDSNSVIKRNEYCTQASSKSINTNAYNGEQRLSDNKKESANLDESRNEIGYVDTILTENCFQINVKSPYISMNIKVPATQPGLNMNDRHTEVINTGSADSISLTQKDVRKNKKTAGKSTDRPKIKYNISEKLIKIEGKKICLKRVKIISDLLESTLKLSNNVGNAEKGIIKAFIELDIKYQNVCLKLLTSKRKWNNIFEFCRPYNKIMSNEDIIAMVEDLKLKGIIDTDYSRESVIELLPELYDRHLKGLCAKFKLGKIQNRKHMINCISEWCCSSQKKKDLLKEEINIEMGDCMKINKVFKDTFNTVYLLGTFPNPKFSNIDVYFDTILKNKQPPKYPVNEYAIFSSRNDFTSFAEARKLQDEFETFKEAEDRKLICEQILSKLKAIQRQERNDEERLKNAPHLIQFTARAVYSSTLSKAADVLHVHYPEDVKSWLEYLIGQINSQHELGNWYYSLTQHYINKKCGSYENAAKYLIEILEKYRENKDLLSDIQFHRFYEGGNICIKNHKVKAKMKDQLRKLLPKCIGDFREEKDSKRLKKCHGSINCQGTDTILCIFMLLFFDIIYSDRHIIPGTFVSKIQSEPLDMNTRYFYMNRKDEIDKRLNEVHSGWSDDQLFEFLIKNYQDHSHEFAVCEVDMFIKNQDLLEPLVRCIGREILAKICERLVRNFGECREGIPDLLLHEEQERSKCTFVTVRGNKKLSVEQLLWLEFLRSNGADVVIQRKKKNVPDPSNAGNNAPSQPLTPQPSTSQFHTPQPSTSKITL